jgi:hypothetical protein
MATQISEHLVRHARSDATGIHELAIVAVVAEQKRAKIRPRSFRVSPADDEFLAIEPFLFAPEAPVSRRIRRIDRPSLVSVGVHVACCKAFGHSGHHDQSAAHSSGCVAASALDPAATL